MHELSTTQSYSAKELNQHLDVWIKTQEILESVGINFYKLRLATAIRNTLVSLVKLSKNSIDEYTFKRFSNLDRAQKNYLIGRMNLADRFKEVFDALLKENYTGFLEKIKHRILINGYDLKFVEPIVKYLSKDYNIRIDEWTGHNVHNEKQSIEMLKWADTIWCEWMLGNSVWYSKYKSKYQALIIRAHRFELYREFGYEIDFGKVNAVIAVGYYYLNKFSEKFKIPRGKIKLISNYVEQNIYTGVKTDGYKKHIALCGILPRRKGFFKAIKLIESLKQKDSEFKLYIIGDRPEDVDWIQSNKGEKEYYDTCYQYIEEHGLNDSIIFTGRMERCDMFKDVGYVLSLSDHEKPESFHLTPAEAIADNSIALLLDWPGVEYIYPRCAIKDSIDSIEETILDTVYDEAKYNMVCIEQKQFVLESYSIDRYLDEIKKLICIVLVNM
jgi:glycosyltransferase involved in cell wall biosynthesis